MARVRFLPLVRGIAWFDIVVALVIVIVIMIVIVIVIVFDPVWE